MKYAVRTVSLVAARSISRMCACATIDLVPRLILPLALVAGCSSKAPAVDIIVVASAAMSDATLASVRELDFGVSGVESVVRKYSIAQFPADRQERVVYSPRASSGAITIAVDALDGAGNNLAHGDGSVNLKGGTVPLTIALGDVSSDGGVPLDDLAIGPDFASACSGAADGTVCGLADACHSAATCVSGVCTTHQASDGTLCGNADACHMAPTCVSGSCTPHPLPDGTVCASTSNACKDPGTCTSGACGAITNKGSGTVCSPASNACHTNGVCDGNGNCGSQGTRSNGYSYDGVYNHRCCGGNPVDTNTDVNNCSVCGWRCNPGFPCISAHGGVYCECNYYNSGCSNNQTYCSDAVTYWGGAPDICAAPGCATNGSWCAQNGFGSCTGGVNGPVYCHY